MSPRILLLCCASFSLLLLSSSASFPDAPDREKITAPVLPRPERKLFALKSDAITLRQALAELSNQTGIRVENLRGEPDSPIRIDLKQATFWQALDTIAKAASARVRVYPTTGRIVLDKRGPNYRLPPISYDGRFRLCVKKTTGSRELELSDADPAHGAYSVSIEVAWDPELQPLFLETRPHAVRLVDDKKNAVVIPEEGSSLTPVDGLIALSLDLRLPALPRTVARIATLEGELSMIGPSKMLTFTFDTLDKLGRASANDPERRLTQEGVTCHIRKVVFDRERWTIQVALDYPPGMKQLDSNQSWVVNNAMVLESTDGKKHLVSSQYVVKTATARQAVLSYHFLDKGELVRGKAKDWKVRYRTPANLIDMPIKFAFKDIALP